MEPVGRPRVGVTDKPCIPNQRGSSTPPSAPKTRGTGAPIKKTESRIARNCHLTQSEKVQLAMEYQALPEDTRGRRIGVAKLCKRYHVCPSYVTNSGLIAMIMGAAKLDAPADRKDRCDAGVPRKFTEEVKAVVKEKAREWGWEFSYDDIATELEELGYRVARSTIRRNLGNDEWTATRMRVLPMLKTQHREERLAYANEHQGDDWYCQVDLDEKWVYGMHTHALLKLPSDEPVPVQSKRHLPKVMMLTALARPRFDHEGKCVFDGKICCERVMCEPTGPRAKKAFQGRLHERG